MSKKAKPRTAPPAADAENFGSRRQDVDDAAEDDEIEELDDLDDVAEDISSGTTVRMVREDGKTADVHHSEVVNWIQHGWSVVK